MKPIVLAAALPLALAACNFGTPGGNASKASTANTAAPEVVPDSVTVNGVTYVRAGVDKVAPATVPAPAPAATAPSTSSAPVSDTGASVPTNTDTGGASADHGN